MATQPSSNFLFESCGPLPIEDFLPDKAERRSRVSCSELNAPLSSNPTPFGMNPMHSLRSKLSVCLLLGMACALPRNSATGGGDFENMKLIDFKNKAAATLFSLAILLGICFAASGTAEAQYRTDRNDRYQRNRDGDRDYREQRRRQRDTDWRNNNWRRGRYNDGYPDLGGSFDLRQTALNAGFNEGVKAGRDDRRRGRGFEYRDQNAFRKATKDYSSRLGDRGIYQTYFREAYANGYADGYSGY
jgi:hypothetical protein